MRSASILFKNEEAGILIQHDDASFSFHYHDTWLANPNKPAISLGLPKVQQEFKSDHLFPFFYNLLPEGSNKEVVCKLNRIDRNDYFGLLLTTAKNDCIGAVRVIEIIGQV